MRRTQVKASKSDGSSGIIHSHKLKTRALKTIDIDDRYWTDFNLRDVYERAYVRVLPPYNASDGQIAMLESDLRLSGAAGVKVHARAPAPLVIPSAEVGDAGNAVEDAFTSPRDVIASMVVNARTQDREALAAVVDKFVTIADVQNHTHSTMTDVSVGYISDLRLQNWLCYRGVNELKLSPTVYSITAEQVSDPDRSNWLGKSSFLRAIVFLLTGKHPCKTANDWITRGEQEGAVEAEFSSGLFISRSRIRGRSTQLEVSVPGHPEPYVGDVAQAWLNEHVIDEDTLFKTSYFEQKRTDRFITMGPADRSATVNGWLGIEWVGDAGDLCRARLNELVSKEDSLSNLFLNIHERYISDIRTNSSIAIDLIAVRDESVLRTIDVARAAAWMGLETAKDVVLRANQLVDRERAQLAEKAIAVQKVDEAKRLEWVSYNSAVEAAEQRVAKENSKVVDSRNAIDEYDRRLRNSQRAVELERELARPLIEVDALRYRTVVMLVGWFERQCGVARADLALARKSARGQFDGVCPVAGMQCPAKAVINQDNQETRTMVDQRSERVSKLECTLTKLAVERDALRDLLAKNSAMQARREALENEVRTLREDAEWVKGRARPTLYVKDATVGVVNVKRPEPAVYPTFEPIVDELGLSPRESLAAALHSKSECQMKLERIDADIKESDRLAHEIISLRKEIQVYREAMLILGRNGAQREIAEKSLKQIETDGNRAISAAGIDLRLEVSWSQETNKPADACDECGASFPASARIVRCTRCGAARGKKLSNELRIALSSESGGAEDLAGCMFQLAAANWLRKYNRRSWSIFLIDEPFGALDRANVRSLATHLSRLLGEQFGSMQSFIVAHHADVLESTPGRIHITSEYGASKIAVL